MNIRRVTSWLIHIALAIGVGASSVSVFAGDKYALLIGVSGYPNLPPPRRISGPANDVQLMSQVLARRGFEVRVLAHEVPGALGDPTRSEILAELSRLATTVQSGDFVFIELSGHGAQQPWRFGSKPEPEFDGWNEIFLPYDVRGWTDQVGVENAISDSEIAAALSRIEQTGAFVWAVFDTCHSGGLTRGVQIPGDHSVERTVEPRDLGIPDTVRVAALNTAPAVAKNMPTGEPQQRTQAKPLHVYLYAAQKWEKARERVQGDRNVMYGDLTWNVALALEAVPAFSYRQLGEYIRQLYSAQGISATPGWEGSGLDAPVLGQRGGQRVWQWTIERNLNDWTIPAGQLNQLTVGDRFAIYESALASPGDAVGYARATKVDLLRTALSPEAYDEKPKLDRLPAGAVARPVEGNVRFVVRVSRPPPIVGKGERADFDAQRRVLQATDDLAQSPVPGLRIEWVESGDRADIRLAVSNGKLWFAPPEGDLVTSGPDRPPSIDLTASETSWKRTFRQTLIYAAKAINLRRLALPTAVDGNFFPNVTIELHVSNDQGTRIYGGWQIPRITAGDEVHFVVTYEHPIPMYLTIFAIDSMYNIWPMYPAKEEIDESRLISDPRPGAKRSVTIPRGKGIRFNCGKECGPETYGKESFVFIMMEAPAHTTREDLSFFATDKPGNLDELRGKAFSTLLFEAGFGNSNTGTRSGVRNVAIWARDYVVTTAASRSN